MSHRLLKAQHVRPRLWLPSGRSLSLAGVVRDDGGVNRGDEMESMLEQQWRRTFPCKDTCEQARGEILNKGGSNTDLSGIA